MPSKLKDPGIYLTVVLIAYTALVFVWWPTDIYFLGFTLVLWLMFIGLFVWFALCIVYVNLIKKQEEKRVAEFEKSEEVG